MSISIEKRSLSIPNLVIIWPMLLLIFFIPPFTLIISPLVLFDLYEMFLKLFLEGLFFLLYMVLIVGVFLNLGNAVFLSIKQRFEDLQSAFYRIRFMSVMLYPALVWGMIMGVFFLLGPSRNEHVFYSISFSLPVLNLSGTFYAIPLILHLRKAQKLRLLGTIFCMTFSMVIGLDLLVALFIRKKLKE